MVYLVSLTMRLIMMRKHNNNKNYEIMSMISTNINDTLEQHWTKG